MIKVNVAGWQTAFATIAMTTNKCHANYGGSHTNTVTAAVSELTLPRTAQMKKREKEKNSFHTNSFVTSTFYSDFSLHLFKKFHFNKIPLLST